MTSKRRIAITGIGLVTPVGNDTRSTWEGLQSGKSGLGEIRYFDASGFPVRIGAEIKDIVLPESVAKSKQLKFASRSHRFGLAAAEEALSDAGIRPEPRANRWLFHPSPLEFSSARHRISVSTLPTRDRCRRSSA